MAKKSKDSVVYSDEDMALKNKEISELSTKLLAIQTQLAQFEFWRFQVEERLWATQRWRPSKG